MEILKSSTVATQKRLRELTEQQSNVLEHSDEECPICMDRPVDTVLSCAHGLCKVCEVEWLIGEGRGTCPICRAKEKEGDDWVWMQGCERCCRQTRGSHTDPKVITSVTPSFCACLL